MDIEINEQHCIELESFIRNYTPTSWKERIGSVIIVPYLIETDLQNILEGNYPHKFQEFPVLKTATEEWIKLKRGLK